MLTQGKDEDKEKWQNSRREACYTLSIEGNQDCLNFHLTLLYATTNYKEMTLI